MEETKQDPVIDTTESKKSKKKFKPVRLISTLLIIALIIAIFFSFVGFVNSSTAIIPQTKSANCNADNCIQIQTVYQDGWALWKWVDFLPPFFSISAGGYQNGDKTLVTCPVKSNADDFISKLGFFFNTPDIQKCVVTAR